MFPSIPNLASVLFLAGILLAGMAGLMRLERWTTARTLQGRSLAIGSPAVVYWLAAIPVMALSIALIFALLILPLMSCLMMGGAWLWGLPVI